MPKAPAGPAALSVEERRRARLAARMQEAKTATAPTPTLAPSSAPPRAKPAPPAGPDFVSPYGPLPGRTTEPDTLAGEPYGGGQVPDHPFGPRRFKPPVLAQNPDGTPRLRTKAETTAYERVIQARAKDAALKRGQQFDDRVFKRYVLGVDPEAPKKIAQRTRKTATAREVLDDPSKRKGFVDLDLPGEHPVLPVPVPIAPAPPRAPASTAPAAPPGPPVPAVSESVTPQGWVPRVEGCAHVTPDDVWKLAKLNCTQEEAAGWFRVPTPVFRKLLREDPVIQEAWDSGQHTGRVSFRRLQLAAAEGGNAAMMIFLGKNLLGQKDNAALQVNTTEGSADKQALVERLIKAGEKMAARGRGDAV